MPLDTQLLDILVCPEDHGPLHVSETALYNPRLRRRYSISDGIPIMLIDEATEVTDDAEHTTLSTGVLTGGESAD